MSKIKIVSATILALLLLILVLQNTEVVTVAFLFWKFEMSRVVLILLAVMTGFICGYLVRSIFGSIASHGDRSGPVNRPR